ncbi:hypothetical protein [Streptomyces sp. BH105]|uniref:hypothetical protein n=1 Tax=Streptomyces sp. BH105 TaxID=3410408 RepID=UPI003CF97B17
MRSKFDGNPVTIYHQGENWTEQPVAHHVRTENLSETEPARLLVVFVSNTGDKLKVDDPTSQAGTHTTDSIAAHGPVPLLNEHRLPSRMHTRDALKKGENPDRIAVLPGWEETGDKDYHAAAAVLTADQVAAIAWLATVMNAFDRVAITSKYPVHG